MFTLSCRIVDPDLEIVTSKDGYVTLIFFQDQDMKDFFRLYPEIVLMDATYKLTNVRMPLYVLLCVGPNGESAVVCVFLTVAEDTATLATALDKFKERNDQWPSIKTVMTDKDMAEREAIRQQFPDATLLLCLFHVMWAMSREITTAKMGIREEQRCQALKALQSIAYASSENQYNVLHAQLTATMPAAVVQYFDTHWHPCRQEWVHCWQQQNVTFGEWTNNRIESINQRLKAVIRTGSTLPVFFKDLTATLACMRQERSHALSTATEKVRVTPYEAYSVEAKFLAARTPFAFKQVCKQLQLADAVTVTVSDGIMTADNRGNRSQ